MTTQRQYVALGGGIDTETPVLSVAPGFVREAWNYEQAVDGGYRRIDGIERFDGQPAPSGATYLTFLATITGTITVGSTLTGVTSGATGKALAVRAGEIDVTAIVGTFLSGETVNAGVAVLTSTGLPGTDALIQADAADVRRALIQAVPGSGPVRGVFKFSNVVYAFRNNAAGTAKKLFRATSTGWVEVTTPALNPGGVLETVTYNFGSGSAIYGCDGANKAFKFDGTTYTQITTGMADDRPQHIAAHQNHLFLAFGHSAQHSPIGDPLATWSPVLGAGEINVGAVITNMVPQPGQQGSGAMAISTATSLFVLYGTSSANWSLVTLQSEVGARPGSMQNVGVAFMMGDMGVTVIGQSQAYGNFAHSIISHRAQSWIDRFGQNLTASTVHRSKNQYRLFFGTRALFITVRGQEVAGMMPIEFPVDVFCCTTTPEDETFIGASDGFVYQADSGDSFDGAVIDSILVFPFNSNKSVRQRKRYRRLLAEISSQIPVQMTANFSLAYGDFDIEPLSQIGFSSADWDVATWDVETWDGGVGPIARVDLDGTGENISIALSHSGRATPAFSIRSFILEFSLRRSER